MSASWPMRTPISNLASPNMSPRTSLLLPHPLGPHPPLPLPLPLLLHRPTRITTNTRTTRYPQSLSGLLPLWLQAESFPHRKRTIRGCCPKQTNRSESSRSHSTRPKRRTRRTFLVQPAVLLLVSLTICAQRSLFVQLPVGNGGHFQRVRVHNGAKHEVAARAIRQGRDHHQAHVRRTSRSSPPSDLACLAFPCSHDYRGSSPSSCRTNFEKRRNSSRSKSSSRAKGLSLPLKDLIVCAT